MNNEQKDTGQTKKRGLAASVFSFLFGYGLQNLERIAGYLSGQTTGAFSDSAKAISKWCKDHPLVSSGLLPVGLIFLAALGIAYSLWLYSRDWLSKRKFALADAPSSNAGNTLGGAMPTANTAQTELRSALVEMKAPEQHDRPVSDSRNESKSHAIGVVVKTSRIEPITLFRAKVPNPVPALKIEYDKAHHLTKDPSGLVQFRLRVMNSGTTQVRGLKVSLKSLSPLAQAKKLSAYTTQFNDVPLRFAKPELASVLNPGDGVEVFVSYIRPDAPKDMFFTGTTRDFNLPRGKVLASILATAENANPIEQKFEVTANGRLLAINPLSPGNMFTKRCDLILVD